MVDPSYPGLCIVAKSTHFISEVGKKPARHHEFISNSITEIFPSKAKQSKAMTILHECEAKEKNAHFLHLGIVQGYK